MAVNVDDVKRALAGLNVGEIVEKAARTAAAKVAPQANGGQLDEAYVAQPKVYEQVTEFVSEETKQAHRKLYEELIASLNRVSLEIDAADRAGANDRSSKYRSLRFDEARLLNAVWLHELYFSNCFDPHSTVYMDSPSYLELQRQWGTFDAWQQHFIATAMAGGHGFVMTGLNTFLKQFTTTFVDDYSQSAQLGFIPVLAIDMHEHARMDFGTDMRAYLIAMMREIRWTVVDERIQKAKLVVGALR